MDYHAITQKASSDLDRFSEAASAFDDGLMEIELLCATLISRDDGNPHDVTTLSEILDTGIEQLKTCSALIVPIVGHIDAMKAHYEHEEAPEVVDVIEIESGWKRFVPGLSKKKVQIVMSEPAAPVRRQAGVSQQQAFINAREWNQQLSDGILKIDATFEPTVEVLEDRIVDLKEAAIVADRVSADNPSVSVEARKALARRLCLEAAVKAMRDHIVDLGLHKREFSGVANTLRKALQDLETQDDFFNVKSDEDIERLIGRGVKSLELETAESLNVLHSF